MKRILVVEPYFGGSHKQFLLGLEKYLEAEFIFLTLPARKWKMRMQLSAPWFASCVQQMDDRYFDRVLCSTFVDVAVLKALLVAIDGWNSECQFCTYFHENQFAYPHQMSDGVSSHQFTAINFTTALVSDRIAFNSKYNYSSFMESCRKYVKKAADIDISKSLDKIERKARIIYPGVDFSDFPSPRKSDNEVPIIVWNHRWEHDKNPEGFFAALAELQEMGCAFKISILGQSFRDIPQIFHTAKEKFMPFIEHFGYVESRSEYVAHLCRGDIVVSTADHEFFGVAVIEAVHAGCYPLVPDRLSYPELYDQSFLYTGGTLAAKLASLLAELKVRKKDVSNIETGKFGWPNMIPQYHQWLFGEK